MTYSVEFIVNTGQFEHAKLTISSETVAGLDKDLWDLNTDLAAAIGRTAFALNGAVKHGYKNPITDPEPDPVDVVKSGLGATVVETIKVVGADGETVIEKPWKRPVTAAQAKPWESAQPATEAPVKAPSTSSLLDDF